MNSEKKKKKRKTKKKKKRKKKKKGIIIIMIIVFIFLLVKKENGRKNARLVCLCNHTRHYHFVEDKVCLFDVAVDVGEGDRGMIN